MKRNLSNIQSIAGVKNQATTDSRENCKKESEMVLSFKVGDEIEITEQERNRKKLTLSKGRVIGIDDKSVYIKSANYTTTFRKSELYYQINLKVAILN